MAPVQTALFAVNSGATVLGAVIVCTWSLQPANVPVTITLVPDGIPVIVPTVVPVELDTVPAELVIIVARFLLKVILYVAPLQIPELKLILGVAHAVVQSNGLVTTAVLVQLPNVAVIVTFVPTAIPVIAFPLLVPELDEIKAPAVAFHGTL